MRRRSSLKKAIQNNDADMVVAATAGLDNWQTWAGRSHGSEEFQVFDLFRGMKRSLHNRFLSAPPPPGATCPVCFCEPEQPDEWHVTSSCLHAVCLDCLKAYASNQVHDKEQHGPLKCPVCPQVLRRSDAMLALGDDKALIRQWDVKIRNQVLRALPSYRSCPKCHNSDSDSDNMGGGGGGFVTPECLSPHYQERRRTATRRLYGIEIVGFALLLLYIVMVTYIGNTPSRSAAVDLFFMMALIVPLLKLGRNAQAWVAESAREAFFKPLTVECPCCDQPFILPPELEAKNLEDEETSLWLTANTRPCPSCSVPINKNGGCNHIRCSHCHASFCWACMKLRTNCGAYACKRGAPYRNAMPNALGGGGGAQPVVPNDSILTTIDYLLDRQRQGLQLHDGFLVGVALVGRDIAPIQTVVGSVVGSIMGGIVCLFTTQFASVAILFYTLFLMSRGFRNHLNRIYSRFNRTVVPHQHPGIDITGYGNFFGAEEQNLQDRQPNNAMVMTEQEMLAEAMRRSIQDQ